MKKLLSLLILSHSLTIAASDCHPPSQGHLEGVLKDSFYASKGESELREWMNHPNNTEIKKELKALDRRSKFTTRLKREELYAEAQVKFETAILNNERSDEMENFPVVGTRSKISTSQNTLILEMSNFSKDDLNVIPKEILEKLEPKVKINYYFPYDKFEYLLTYEGKELPMNKALQKVQAEMETLCEMREIENGEYRRWYQKNYGGDGNGRYGADKGVSGKGAAGKGGSAQ